MYRLFPLDDLDLSRQIDNLFSIMNDLTHVAWWDLYRRHALAHVSLVGSVFCR